MKVILLSTATLFALGCASTQSQQTAQKSSPPQYQQPAYQQEYQQQEPQRQAFRDDFVGERGADGPAGARGAQGREGQTGASGYAVAGPRGEAGPAGAAGPQGPTGERGAAGSVVRGPTGEVGPAGADGAQGPTGQTGDRGASAEGYAGPAGPAGPTGPVGPAGETGERGENLVGPAGPAGRTGPAGERGQAGQTGETGNITPGVAGAEGVAGPAGPRGEAGPIGPMGPTGLIENWASYRDFWFEQDMTRMHEADRYLVSEIATYMQANPTLELGIDASTNPLAKSQRELTLRDSRINWIRGALIEAGVPADRISTGQFGDVDHRRDGRVEILLRTDRQVYSQSGTAMADSSPQQGETQASIGMVNDWTNYESFWFAADESSIHSADQDKVSEIAVFMKRNPSMQICVDSSLSPNGSPQHSDQELATRRGNVVRDALIAAGVPASSIQSGEFSSPDARRIGRVAVLIKTDRLAQTR